MSEEYPLKNEVESSWICSCGSVNTGKFCSECGASKTQIDQQSISSGNTQSECGSVPPSGFQTENAAESSAVPQTVIAPALSPEPQTGFDGVPSQTAQVELTAAQKIGWFFVGVLLSIPGILIASLTNIDKPYRSDATKYATIGLIIEIVFTVIMFVVSCSSVAAKVI